MPASKPSNARKKNAKVPGIRPLRAIELFSGAGGLALGLHLAGFGLELLAECDGNAFETLEWNRKNGSVPGIKNWTVLNERVEKIDLSEFEGIDLIAAGVPCQPFSNGGQRLGIKDERNMFPAFAKLLSTVKPKAFLVENVNGLTNGALKKYLEYVQLQLTRPHIGKPSDTSWRNHQKDLRAANTGNRRGVEYRVSHQVLNAADFGVPQIRKRIFFVGFRTDLDVDWQFPKGEYSQRGLVYDQWVTGDYWLNHGVRRSSTTQPSDRLLEDVLMAGPGQRRWQTVRDVIVDLPAASRSNASASLANHFSIPGARTYRGHSGSTVDYPSKPLKAGVHGVPGGENILVHSNGKVRYFTLRECARIQTFPDEWTFQGSRSDVVKQIGNAVPVELGKVVATAIATTLKSIQI